MTDKAKTIVVLCPGPSLLAFAKADAAPSAPERLAAVIGVNRVVTAFQCDYWVCLDVHAGDQIEVGAILGAPTIVAGPGVPKRIARRHRQAADWPTLVHTEIDLPRDQVAWGRFGATTAVALAASLGAKLIRCFGVNWKGTADFDGFEHIKQRRDEARWDEERALWTALAGLLESRGVRLERVGEAA